MINRSHKVISLLLSFILCFTLSGCDAIYRLLDKEGAQEKALIGQVIPFEKNEIVEEAQALLYLYGYNTGKVDGALGLRTRNAVERFQKDNNLKPSRFIDQATWAKLNLFKDMNLVVDRQLNLRLIQAILKNEGFKPGEVDGKMGAKTQVAIEKFQKANDLKVDGKVGYQTLKKLAGFIPDEAPIE